MQSDSWKIPHYYYFIQTTGIFVSSLIWVAVYLFPHLFIFLGKPLTFLFSFGTVIVLHTLLFALQSTLHKKLLFSLQRHIWMLFFFFLIATTGGLSSPVLYLLIFPIIVSAVDLEEKQTAAVGILTIVFMIASFFISIDRAHPELIAQHIFVIFIFATISWYVYTLVRSTLHARYEKEVAEQELEKMHELDILKSDFITVVSHRLRSPLWGVSWALSELSNSPDAEQAKLAKGGNAKAEEALDIINELIRTVELDMTGFKLEKKEIPMKAMIERIIQANDYLIRAKSVTLVADDLAETSVVGDSKFLELAIGNIVHNAIAYAPEGKVSIEMSKEGGMAEIVVKDTGIGISKEDMQLIFQRLYRGKNALSLEPNQSGVGLYTTRRILELHGGSITIESELGKGTTATICLPCA